MRFSITTDEVFQFLRSVPVIIGKFVTIFFCVHREAFAYRNNKGVLRFVIHVTRLLAKKKSAKKCQDSNAKQSIR